MCLANVSLFLFHNLEHKTDDNVVLFSVLLVILMEYLCGRKLILVRPNSMSQTLKKKKPIPHFGDWHSIKSSVHTRFNDNTILLLFLMYNEREMKFERWTRMLDTAVNSIEALMQQTEDSFLSDIRNLLLSTKQVIDNFSTNIHYNDPKKNAISLRIVFKYTEQF